MKKITGLLLNIFKSKYSAWSYVEDELGQEEIYKNKFEDLSFNDPDQLESVPTGTFRSVTYEIWKRNHIKTGLPQYKRIKKL
jgi:hypothetical protein